MELDLVKPGCLLGFREIRLTIGIIDMKIMLLALWVEGNRIRVLRLP